MIKLRLRELLDDHQLSAYRLGQEVEGLTMKAVQMYASGVRQPSLASVGKIMTALNRLPGKRIGVTDLLEYQSKP